MFSGGQRGSPLEERICTSFLIGEETYGFGTDIFGICQRHRNPHSFRISAEKVSRDFQNSFHGNTKYSCYALNFRLCAALQQMGCGYTDAGTLGGFLDLPVCSDTLRNGMKRVEQSLGSIEMRKREESEIDGVAEEIAAMRENNDYNEHSCDIEGHQHPPLPMVKGTYG